MCEGADFSPTMADAGGTPNTVHLAPFGRRTGFQPVARTIFPLILQGIAVIDPMEIR